MPLVYIYLYIGQRRDASTRRGPLLRELDRLRRAVDLEGQAVDLHRALGVLVDLGADLDAGQPHVVGEAAAPLAATEPVDDRLDVDLAVDRGRARAVGGAGQE